MANKSINSTEAQNNFGLVLNDIVHNRTRYIVVRHGVPQVVMIGLDDVIEILSNDRERAVLREVLTGLRPEYALGETVGEDRNKGS
jgi:prevent-host-death family protein